jgi:cysteine desulfurase
VEGEALMLYLDSYGICASTSSACSTGTTEASHVLLAIGRGDSEAKSSIRFTLGKYTQIKDINYLLKILPPLVKELKKVKKLK